MPTEVDAQLLIEVEEDDAGGQRQLHEDDLNVVTQGAATETTLAAVLAALAADPATETTLAAVLASLATRLPRRDDYSDGEVLADQAGADAVLTFTFSSEVNMVLVRSVGATSRADPFGGTPASDTGIICADDEPTYIVINTSIVDVYAPAGATVAVAGMRY